MMVVKGKYHNRSLALLVEVVAVNGVAVRSSYLKMKDVRECPGLSGGSCSRAQWEYRREID